MDLGGSSGLMEKEGPHSLVEERADDGAAVSVGFVH